MHHVRLKSVDHRPLTEDEATALRLPSAKPVPELEDWPRILFQAADIIDHFGWCRAALEREGRHCAVGAILAAYHRGEVRDADVANALFSQHPALKLIAGKVTSYLGHLADSNEVGLMTWNDDIARNGEEVAEMLRAVARG